MENCSEDSDKSVRLPRNIHKKLKLAATENDKSVKAYLTEIIEEKLEE